MNSRKYFGTDGIRGLVGQGNINPEFVLKLGWAAGKVFSKEKSAKVLIGKDTRISGYMFESALEAGLSAAGANVLLLGPMPTPAIAYLTRTFHAQAGIVISASHNPYHDNGIKFFSGDGVKLDDDIELEIEAMLDVPMQTRPSFELGKVRRIVGARGRYIEFCKSTLPFHSRNFSAYKIVVDCAHGATYDIAPDVFDELGAEVVAIAVDPDGYNINENCGSTDPAALQKAVLEHKADFGIGFDGDGDRLVFVDEKGNVVDGDEIVYIIAKHRQKIGKMEGGVVGTVMSNLGLEVALKEMGLEFVRSKVGDRYVMNELTQRQWVLGGESSGHILCLDKTTTGDGIISALQVLFALRDSGGAFSELCKGLKKFPQCMVNVPLKNNDAATLMSNEKLKSCLADAQKSLGKKGRILLRPSGTEPLIRVMVEGEDEKLVKHLANDIASNIAREITQFISP
jgi:phosphoglucosamine mutase